MGRAFSLPKLSLKPCLAIARIISFSLVIISLPYSKPTSALPEGTYQAFAALAEPGSVQAGSPRIIGNISLVPFSFIR